MLKSLLLKSSLVFASLACSVVATHAAMITWGAATDYGVGTQNGTILPLGNLVMLGSFGSLTPAQIRTASFSTLQSSFVNYDVVARHIGDGSPVSGGSTPAAADAGFWKEANDTNSTSALAITGLPMYFWVFNATTLAAATEEGIFTAAFNGATTAIQNNWRFVSDTAIPPTSTVDLDNVLPYTTGRTGSTIDRNGIVIGNYGTGISAVNGLPLYNLAPIVPEPSTFALVGASMGLTALRIWRRRRAK